MAVIRLELEVDSAVYPELHAALAAIGSAAGRGERFRQLASTGLVWETVRIHGAAVSQLPGNAPAAVAVTAPAPNPDVLMQPAVQAPGRSGGKNRAADKKTASRPRGGGDFVDLAISVASSAGPSGDPRDPRLLGGEIDLPNDIPMLLDVVTPPPSIPRSRNAAAAKAPMPPAPKLRQPAAVEPPSALEEAFAESGEPSIQDDGLVHKSVVRSRLLRMKEKGLFRNG